MAFEIGERVRVRREVGPEWQMRGVVSSRVPLGPHTSASSNGSTFCYRITVTHTTAEANYSVGTTAQWWDEHLEKCDGLLDV